MGLRDVLLNCYLFGHRGHSLLKGLSSPEGAKRMRGEAGGWWMVNQMALRLQHAPGLMSTFSPSMVARGRPGSLVQGQLLSLDLVRVKCACGCSFVCVRVRVRRSAMSSSASCARLTSRSLRRLTPCLWPRPPSHRWGGQGPACATFVPVCVCVYLCVCVCVCTRALALINTCTEV